MQDGSVQKRLFTKEDLTFAKALELAETVERASKDAEQLHSRLQQEVHQVGNPQSAPRVEGKDRGSTDCYRCGGKHEQQMCKFRFGTCRYCRKKGHIERVCRKRQAETEGAGKRDLDTRVKDLGEDDTQFDDESYQSGWNAIHGIRAMKQWRSQSPMFVEVKVEGLPIQMELDTGAAVSILPLRMYYEKIQAHPIKKYCFQAKDLH